MKKIILILSLMVGASASAVVHKIAEGAAKVVKEVACIPVVVINKATGDTITICKDADDGEVVTKK